MIWQNFVFDRGKKKKKSRKSPVRVLNSDPSRFQREVVPVEVTTHEKCISG
jgi:hypothetical protein